MSITIYSATLVLSGSTTTHLLTTSDPDEAARRAVAIAEEVADEREVGITDEDYVTERASGGGACGFPQHVERPGGRELAVRSKRSIANPAVDREAAVVIRAAGDVTPYVVGDPPMRTGISRRTDVT